MHCFLCLFYISLLNKVFSGCFREAFFNLRDKKKWLLVVLDMWLSYTVTIAWEFVYANSALFVIDKW